MKISQDQKKCYRMTWPGALTKQCNQGIILFSFSITTWNIINWSRAFSLEIYKVRNRPDYGNMGSQVFKWGMSTKLDLKKIKTRKGQLISKDLFDVIGLDQKTKENFLSISALASKKVGLKKWSHFISLIRGYLTQSYKKSFLVWTLFRG